MLKLNNFFPQIQSNGKKSQQVQLSLIRREAVLGGELFGPIPSGHRREFFCLDEHTWVWHEEWLENGQTRSKTTRYEVQPDRVLKIQNGQYYTLDKDEAKNLYRATQLYGPKVLSKLYAQTS